MSAFVSLMIRHIRLSYTVTNISHVTEMFQEINMKTRQAPHCDAICTLSVYKLRLQIPEGSWLVLGCRVCCKISAFMKSKYKCSK